MEDNILATINKSLYGLETFVTSWQAPGCLTRLLPASHCLLIGQANDLLHWALITQRITEI
jgi:hypothetical protein